jgi:hypothetical protein
MSTDPRLETLRLLTSIDATLKKLLVALAREPKHDAPIAPLPAPVSLDGPYGDPIIKAKDPKDWTGPPQTGKHFSECPPAYLDLLADRYDYFAGRETDATKAGYNRLDAARARGWAARLRAGWTAPRPDGPVFAGDEGGF